MNTREIDMTQGSLWKKIWIFSLPLLISNLLQVLFGMADLAVVGHFSGAIALGSVGSTTMLANLALSFFLGMGGGTNAVTARFIGAGDRENTRKTVHTALVLCFIVGVVALAAGQILTRPILRLMGTKDELIDGAVLYLKIYLLGSPAVALYNYGNGVLGAVGDTRRPLRYLTIAGVVNVALNLVFVIVFHMGVAGVATASVIAQFLSAFLIMRYLFDCGAWSATTGSGKLNENLRGADYGLRLQEIAVDWSIAGRVLGIGLPAALQYSLFAIANLFIQGAINTFEHVAVEGSAAAANADALVWDMMAAFYTASTSFIAQNLGAGNYKRIRQTYGITILYSALVGLVGGALLIVFRNQFLSIFTDDPEVIAYGRTRLVIMAASYFISAFMDDATAAARGLGKSVIPTIIVILGSVVFRIAWVATVFAYFRTLESIYLVYPTAWVLTSIAGNAYFFIQYGKLRKRSLKAEKTQ